MSGQPRPQGSSNRSTLRVEYFYDHPALASKHESAYTNSSKDKAKVWCKRCFENLVMGELVLDEQRLRAGEVAVVRTRMEIESALWARPKETPSSQRWQAGHMPTMRTHLASCSLQPDEVRAAAAVQHDVKDKSPRKARYRSLVEHGGSATIHSPSPSPSFPQLAGMPGPSSSNILPLTGPTLQYSERSMYAQPSAVGTWLTSMSTSIPSTQFTLSAPYPTISVSSPQFGSNQVGSPALSQIHTPPDSVSTVSPMPSPLVTGLGLEMPAAESRVRALKRRKTGLADHQAVVPWSEACQMRFDRRLARLTAAQGWSLSWVENIEWLEFIEEFLPQALLPSRKVLTKTLIPGELKALKQKAQQQCRGKEGTLETDGWSGVNQLHLVPFMVNVNRQLHTVKVYDTTSRVKNAENLLVMIREVINIVENEWGIIVVAITSDCGGDSRAARKAIVQENTRLVGPDCYAHQINLIVGDYFKVSAWFFIYSEKADQVIRWLRSRTYLLAILRDIQQRIWSRTLAVVRAVLTRWTSHFLAYRRLLEIKNPLEILASDPRIFESGDAKSHAKTREMLPILRDSMFWHYLARIKFHIQPFAIAANVTQSAHCRLDEVLLTFAFLLKQFLELADPDDQLIKEAVITSLETRWAKADQDVFVAAVVLNPFVKAGAFAQLHLFHNAGLMALLSRLWTRFYDTSPPEAFQSEVLEYLSGTGKYEDMESYADAIQAKARQNKTSPDPLEVWKGVSFSGAPPTPLGTLANRILSICANSASVERLFSAFGLILTKLRNRLGTQNLTNLAELKMYIQDEHRQKNSKTRLKRHFETTAARSSAAPTTSENAGSTISLNSPVPVVPSSSIHHAPSSISASVPPSSSDVEPVAESDETTASTSSHIPRTGLRAIVAELHDAIDRDDDVNTTQTFPSRIKEKLSNMFNFQQSYWIESHTRSAMRSLEDEMEVYELLDLDAAGEDNFEEDSGDAILGD